MIEQKQHAQPEQQIGDAIEHVRAAHERAGNLSTQRQYDADEVEPVASPVLETLSFGGGEEHWAPQLGPSDATGPDALGCFCER